MDEDNGEVRVIQCACGMVTEMSVDEQRWHSGDFRFITTTDDIEIPQDDCELFGKSLMGEAIYLCPSCGRFVISFTANNYSLASASDIFGK